MIAELNIHAADSVSTKTVRRELHKSNIHGTAAVDNFRLLTTTLKGEKDGVIIIQSGHVMTGNT